MAKDESLRSQCDGSRNVRTFIVFKKVTGDLHDRKKKSKSVFDFLTYSRETGFLFSYEEVGNLHRANVASNEIGM